jgi:hypothetical protein
MCAHPIVAGMLEREAEATRGDHAAYLATGNPRYTSVQHVLPVPLPKTLLVEVRPYPRIERRSEYDHHHEPCPTHEEAC